MGEPVDQGKGGTRTSRDLDQQTTDLWDVDELEQTPIVSPDFSDSQTRDMSLTLKPGGSWGRYDLGDQLGVGGMGVVYRALDPTLLRPVALKFLRYIDARQSERFFREARAQARIKHPHICEIYEAGIVDGEPFIAMQLIEGDDLGKAALEMRLEEILQLMSQVAEAAHAAHRLGLVHRDLKPSNVMVEQTEDGGWHPYVMDFGLVRDEYAPDVTATGAVLGTLHYMAPEQAAGEKHRIDRRTDVYSMGAMLYRLLLERPLFRASDKMAHVVQILRMDPVRPREVDSSLPEDVETIILKCLEKRPEDRYASAKALADDLQHYLDGEPLAARPVGPIRRLIKKARKHQALTTVIAVATVAILALGGVAIHAQLRTAQQTRLARQFGEDANDIEWIMRVAHMAPLHDIRPEQQQVRDRMADIEERMKTLGRAAQGPGQYAIGRGHLALGEFEEARERLELAWELGHRGDDVAYALGLAYGQLYQGELAELNGIADSELREFRRAEVQIELRDPAVRYLLEGQSTVLAETEYVAGLLALYEERYDAALAKAQAVFERSPTFYEAAILKGAVYNEVGYARACDEDMIGALDSYGLAADSYRMAVAVGRSDVAGYQGLCLVQLRELAARMYQPGDAEGHTDAGEMACNQAITVDPHRSAPHLILASKRVYEGRTLADRGVNPSEALAGAAVAANRAIAADPDQVLAHEWHGLAYYQAADYREWNGADGRPLLRISIASLERATTLEPDRAWSFDLLGRAYHSLAVADWGRGANPMASWERSIAAHERALALKRTSTFLSDLSVVYLSRAQCPSNDASRRVRDVDLAIELGKEGLAKNPDDPYAVPYSHITIGTAHGVRAQILLDQEEDPTADLTRALTHMESAVALAPSWSFPVMMAGWCLAIRGEHERSIGRDPRETLALAKTKLDSAEQLGPDLADVYESRALLLVVEAMYAMDNGESPEPFIEAARAAQAAGLATDPHSAEMLIGAAEVEALDARWALSQDRSPVEALDRARRTLDEAIALEPLSERAHTGLAELYLLTARWERRNGRTAGSWIGKAHQEIALALGSNPAYVHAEQVRDELLRLEETAQPGATQ